MINMRSFCKLRGLVHFFQHTTCHVFLTNLCNMLAQFFRNSGSIHTVFYSLCTCLTSPRCSNVTWCSILTWWFELWVRMIGPYIRWLHSGIAILAICHCVPWLLLHKFHFSKSATRIFNEVKLWIQVFD